MPAPPFSWPVETNILWRYNLAPELLSPKFPGALNIQNLNRNANLPELMKDRGAFTTALRAKHKPKHTVRIFRGIHRNIGIYLVEDMNPPATVANLFCGCFSGCGFLVLRGWGVVGKNLPALADGYFVGHRNYLSSILEKSAVFLTFHLLASFLKTQFEYLQSHCLNRPANPVSDCLSFVSGVQFFN